MSFLNKAMVWYANVRSTMGNDKSKGSALPALALFAEEEQMKVKKLFDHICGEGITVQAHNFKLYVEKSLPEHFVNPVYRCLAAGARKDGIDLTAFASLLSRIFKGTVEERAELIIQLASGDAHCRDVKPTDLVMFLGLLIDEFYQTMSNTQEFHSWQSLLAKGSSEKLAVCLIRQVCFPEWTNKEKPVSSELPTNSLSVDEIEKWLTKTPLIICMMESVFQQCFPVLRKQSYTFPKCNSACTPKQNKATILHFEDVIGIASHLPLDVSDKWRQLFNSVTNGQSFSRLVESITKQGPTVLVAKDEDGHVFGAFASQDWMISAKFRGNGDCFLFQLNPMVEFFQTTGYNDHFFYLNQNQQTLPNGMGFGGQLDYFGVFFDCEYGIGSCSPTCTTYNSPQVSGSPKFKLKFLEVWGVGPIPEKTPPSTRRSVLDKDAEAKMLLEMAGRERVSDGLREEEECE